jgi:MFS transporter, DHA2 family, methylenomycin A resistance protein
MATLQWVIDLYNLSYAVLILTGGTLGDLYGRRRIFILGLLIFAAGSLICALAPSATVLIAGRGVTGVGAALELPTALAILNIAYPNAHERTRAIALWGGMNGLAMAIGPTVGGILVDRFGWRSLFWVILPAAAAALLLAVTRVQESADPRDRQLDLSGQILAIVTLGALSLGFIEGATWGWYSAPTLACWATSVVGVVAFITVEHHRSDPLLPLAIFHSPAFSAAVVVATMMTFGMYGLLFLLPLYLQTIQHQSAVMAGIELLPMSVTFFLVSPLAGRVAIRIGPRVLVGAGMALTGMGILALSMPLIRSGYGAIAASLFLVGLGLGAITGPIATAAVANAPSEQSGLSSSLVNVGRMVGATLGVAALGILFGARLEEATKNVPLFTNGMHKAFMTGGLVELAGACIALIWFRRDTLEARRNPATSPQEVVHRRQLGGARWRSPGRANQRS